jgi:hypothetical protein
MSEEGPRSTFEIDLENLSRSPWESLQPEIRDAIETAWRCGVPPAASALHARWWQIETWLRSLVYVELRAAKGVRWIETLRNALKLQEQDKAFRYMPTPDAQAQLAYADIGQLTTAIEGNWNLFEHALPAHAVWTGKVVELLNIRNRIGHCRRPHVDDLSRLHQTLRDMEAGALAAVHSFNRQSHVNEGWTDPVVDGWVRRQHDDAVRLMDHALGQYGTRMDLMWSRRPWAERHPNAKSIAGKPGYFWHANFFFGGRRAFDVRRFWDDSYLNKARDLIVFACVSVPPSSMEVSFSAVDDPSLISDVIGNCFDAALHSQRISNPMDVSYDDWLKISEGLDQRVQVGTPWSVVGDGDPVRIFGA